MNARAVRMMVAVLVVVLGWANVAQAAPLPQGPVSDGRLIDEIKQAAGGRLQLGRNAETGKVSFIGTSRERPLARAATAGAIKPEREARTFLKRYGRLFGLQSQAQELRLERSRRGHDGRSQVRFQQVYQGVPVLGGELNVSLDRDGSVLVANGEVRPALRLDVQPQVTPAAARDEALALVARESGLPTGELAAGEPELWILDSRLLGGPPPHITALVWRMNVRATDLRPVDELVLIDAIHGGVALHVGETAYGRNRETYTAGGNSSLPGTRLCVETSNPCAPSDADANAAHTLAGKFYDMLLARFGRDSLDGYGMLIKSTVDYCPNPAECPEINGVKTYENAYWNGQQMVYGNGWAMADDIVGHELAHAITSNEANLLYWYEAGAINESFADVFGELFDQMTVWGKDTAGVRWRIGEDVPLGPDPSCVPLAPAIRHMSAPGACAQPDRMTSHHFFRAPDDNGGVHTNSGVNNKAATLLVDGGNFNGRTVTAIGVDATLKIYYEVLTNLLTSGSDYLDLYHALQQGCANLVGTTGISNSTCVEVKDAVLATEMNRRHPLALNREAPICGSGRAPIDLFYDNMEDDGRLAANWTRQSSNGLPAWAADATYSTSGLRSYRGVDRPEAGLYGLFRTAAIAVPATIPAGGMYLRFNHAYAFDQYIHRNSSGDVTGVDFFDGGTVEFSVDNGANWYDADAEGMFTDNSGYDGTLYGGNTAPIAPNPYAGGRAFVGYSQGYRSSRIDLSLLAGYNAIFRWIVATDGSVGDRGWFVDDVRVHRCDTIPTGPSVSRVLNGGFETDKDPVDGKPDQWSVRPEVTRVSSPRLGGSWSAKHYATNNGSYRFNSTYATLTGHPNVLSVSGWFNIPATTDQFSLAYKVQWYNSSKALLREDLLQTFTSHTSGKWVHVAKSFVVGINPVPVGTAYAIVVMDVASLNATIFADDMRIIFGNMAHNSSMELDNDNDAAPDGWYAHARAVRSNVSAQTGAYSLQFLPDDGVVAVGQRVPNVAGGLSYVPYTWLRIPTLPAADSFSFRYEIRWLKSTGAVIRTDTIGSWTAANNAWQLAFKTLTAPAGTVSAELRFVASSVKYPIFVDMATMRPAP